jgi:AcrR family transcriptional regulator
MAGPPGPNGSAERPLSLKERVLNAATAEFAELGYHRSSLRSISERSQATKPMVYYHFQNKDGLYAAAIRHQLEALEARVRSGVDQQGDTRGRLRAFSHTYLSCFMSEYPALAVGLRELPTLPAPVFTEIANTHSSTVVAILKRILRDGVARGELRSHDTDNCARAIIGIMHYYIRGTGLSAEAAIEAATSQVSDYYAAGLLASGADRSDAAASAHA